MQQMESIQRTLEPLQDAIINLAKEAAKLENNPLGPAMADLRKSELELRERLFICQVAKKYGWEDASKMARRKAGEFDDPELAKVLEEREKKNEKDKREVAKARAAQSSQGQKRKFHSGTYGHYKGQVAQFRRRLQGTSTTNSYNSRAYPGGSGRPGYPSQNHSKEIKCYLCDGDHYVKNCPQRKK